MTDVHRQNAELAITAAANVPGWDGDDVDYDRVVDSLLRAELSN